MPEETEVPLEEVQEKVAEAHEHGHAEEAPEGGEGDRRGWTRFVAVTTALLAVVAAIGALQSGLLINEALLAKNEQVGLLTQATDQWNYYQAEGLKALLYQTAAQVLPPGSPAAAADRAQSAHYKDRQRDLQREATRLTDESGRASRRAEAFMARHHVFAFSVSLCQIAIALSAIAALTRRRWVWIIGLVAGAAGTLLLVRGFMPHLAITGHG